MKCCKFLYVFLFLPCSFGCRFANYYILVEIFGERKIKFCENLSFPQNPPRHYVALWGAIKNGEKASFFAFFLKFGVFLKILRGTMSHYGALSKTLKKRLFSHFFWNLEFSSKSSGALCGPMNYGALSKTLKKRFFFAFFSEIWNFPQNPPGHYVALWGASKKRWKSDFFRIFSEIWSFPQNLPGHYVALSKTVKKCLFSFFPEFRSFPQNPSGHYVALWGASKNGEKVFFSHIFWNSEFSSKSSGALYGTMGRYQKRWKSVFFRTFSEIWSFPQNPPGHYVALWGIIKNVEKASFFAFFLKFGVFLKILRGTMWPYGALSKTLKKLFFSHFILKFGIFPQNPPGHYVALWGAIKKRWKSDFFRIFSEIWSFPQNLPGHYVALSKTVKKCLFSFFPEFRSFPQNPSGHYVALWGASKNGEKVFFRIFSEIWSFPQNPPGHYVALWGAIKNVEKAFFFSHFFLKFGIFLKILRGTMWHYGALSKTVKRSFLQNLPGHYMALWGAIKNGEKVFFRIFSEIRSFLQNLPGHYVALWGVIKNVKKRPFRIFSEIRNFPQNRPGHYMALWGAIKNGEKAFFFFWNSEFSSKSSRGTMWHYGALSKTVKKWIFALLWSRQWVNQAWRAQGVHFPRCFPDSHPATGSLLQMPDLSETNHFGTPPSKKHQTDWIRMSLLSWQS